MEIINNSVNITPADMQKFNPDGSKGLLVRSHFYTIQGEGPGAGDPTLFVRLGGCNRGLKNSPLGCKFCDTAFNVEDSTFFTFTDLYNLGMSYGRTIFEPSALARPYTVLDYTFTGGEPLLQGHNLAKFIQFAHEKLAMTENSSILRINVETNGTPLKSFLGSLKDLPVDKRETHRVYVNILVSPKYGNNGKAKDVDLLQGLPMECTPHYYEHNSTVTGPFEPSITLKILVDGDSDSPYHTLPEWADAANLQGAKLYVQPIFHYKKAIPEDSTVLDANLSEWCDIVKTRESYLHASALVLSNPTKYKLSCQTHMLAGLR